MTVSSKTILVVPPQGSLAPKRGMETPMQPVIPQELASADVGKHWNGHVNGSEIGDSICLACDR